MTHKSSVLIFDHDDVRRLLPMRECIDAMRDAFVALQNGEVHQPLRNIVRPEKATGFLGLMPSYRGGAEPVYGLKSVCVFPSNPQKGLDTHLGVVLLSSGETGELLAIANASTITAIRTAAVSALATDLLARRDASTLAIIGTGVQARSHLEAMSSVRTLKNVRIVGRNRERADRFVGGVQKEYDFEIAAADDIPSAVADADIIVTATSSKEPVLRRHDVRDGVHINAVGSSVKTSRELDAALVRDSRLFVDRRESTLSESGDFLMAMEEGAVTPEHIVATIGDLVTKQHPGRQSDREITLFKSLGLAIEDLAAVDYIYRKAQRSGGGKSVDI